MFDMETPMLIEWPKKPALPSDLIQEMELHGDDALRGLLTGSCDGFTGTGRDTRVRCGNLNVTRGQIQDFLKWRAAKAALWIKIGVVAAVAAALFSLIAIAR
jgi:hypothetical protein